MAAMKSTILSVKNLSLNYGKSFSLNNISFDLTKGEIIGLIGPNGSGKTTLMEGLVGLLPAESRVLYKNDHIVEIDELKDLFFYIPDGVRPYSLLPVKSVLEFYKKIFQRNESYLNEVINKLELDRVKNKLVSQLSKGFARRLLLAIGLLSNQPILVLDEPLDGFDIKQLQKIVPILREEASKGRTLFVCIHQLADAERICDQFILLKNGNIISQGSKEELLLKAKLNTGSIEEVFLALT